MSDLIRRDDEPPGTVNRMIEEIATVEAVWAGTWAGTKEQSRQAISAEELAALPAGQLEARWLDANTAGIYRHDQLVCLLPVTRAPKGTKSFIRPAGNIKTRNVFGIINSASHGCLRAATGFAGCERPCYSDDRGRGGCYAADGPWQIRRANVEQGYALISNGMHNDLLRLQLPDDGDASLTNRRRRNGGSGSPRWRVASESSDGSLVVALGLIQMWTRANPTHVFQAISSNHFRPSDAMLAWLAALPNVWLGHSVSGWHSPEELESRFAAIGRYISFGIPTVIWIATDRKWDNQSVLDRALELVSPERIIEAPHQTSKRAKELPLFDINPLGACGDQRYDKDEHLVTWRPTDDGPRPFVPSAKGWAVAKLPLKPKCKGCRLLCGQHVLKTSGGA